MGRDRERTINPGAIPAEWPNGSAFCEEGSDPKRGIGLLGRTFNRGGKHPAWKYLGKGQYEYLGEFDNHLQAHKAISNA